MVRVSTSRNGQRTTRDLLMTLIGAALASVFFLVLTSIDNQSTLSLGRLCLGEHLATTQTLTTDSATSNVASSETGWHPIHVFYGKMNHLTDSIPETWWLKNSPKHQNGHEWFGQHGQDVAVAKILEFKRSGFFVDLAANDAVWASNTFALEQNFGWKGICIEANSFYWYRLSFRNCHAVGAVAGHQDFEEVKVTLTETRVQGPFGGIVGKDFDNKRAKEPQTRYTASLKTILQKFDAPRVIDYLSLDVEGAEEFIMKDFCWDEYTFLVMTIERPSAELQRVFNANGYQKLIDIKRGDTLWTHNSIYEQAKARVAKDGKDIENHSVQNIPETAKS